MGALLFFIFLTLLGILINSIFTPFPLSDNGTVRYNTVPWMTGALIVVNSCIYVFWQSVDVLNYFNAVTDFEANRSLLNLYTKTWTYGFREVYLTDGSSIGGFTSYTSMFMHSDFSHLIGNMIYLWAFGRRIEDACGPWRFLLFIFVRGHGGDDGLCRADFADLRCALHRCEWCDCGCFRRVFDLVSWREIALSVDASYCAAGDRLVVWINRR